MASTPDTKQGSTPDPAPPDPMKYLFDALSAHISAQTLQIQEQIHQNDLKTTMAQELFLAEVRNELDTFRAMLHTSQPANEVPASSAVASSTTLSSPPIPITQVSVSPSNSTDLQSQMMLMLTDSFSKLSTAIMDQKQDAKSDWHKFSGDPKKFRAWYLGVMANISLPPWTDLYDVTTNDVVSTTTNHLLNDKLYSKILLSLEGTAYQNFVSRKHLRANGIRLLHKLVQTYKPRHVPEIIVAKTAEFWGNTKRQSSESIDSYYNRFQELLEDLSDADEPVSTKAAIRHFLFTLGTEFETVQNNFRINNLPIEWKTNYWPTLLSLCRDYYNSVKPIQTSKRSQLNPKDPTFDCEAHQKKVKEWFLQPTKFAREIEAAQKSFSGQCLYHLSKAHQTPNCFVKKECDKSLLETKNGSSSASPSTLQSGNLRHITDDIIDDVPEDELLDEECEDNSNDTNEAVLAYFARMSNHYLRLANVSSSTGPSRHPMQYPIIADSGASHHMFKEKEFFTFLQPTSGSVLLGDGKTRLSIQGIGTVQCYIDKNLVTLEDVRFIPDLGESVYSLLLHIKQADHGLQSTPHEGLFLKFPTFTSKAIIGSNDIYVNTVPCSTSPLENSSSSTDATVNLPLFSESPLPALASSTCQDNWKQNNLLGELRDYYNQVKTKRQLKLNVPAGFRQPTHTQRLFVSKIPPRDASAESTGPDISSDGVQLHHLSTDEDTVITSNLSSLPSGQLQCEDSDFIPIIRSVDKPSSSLPSHIAMSEDFIRSSVGFRKFDTLKKHFSQL